MFRTKRIPPPLRLFRFPFSLLIFHLTIFCSLDVAYVMLMIVRSMCSEIFCRNTLSEYGAYSFIIIFTFIHCISEVEVEVKALSNLHIGGDITR